MEKAKQAAKSFLSEDGRHKTTVHEDLRPAVTEEHIRPQQHEKVTTAVDKDIHQDHHHTTIQPLKAQEVLPEKHSHNVLPTEHKTVKHGNDAELRATLERDAAKFKNTTVTHDTTASASAGPVLSGEHVHHHVHEHVQPVIQKETIAPHVVHTTAPVHETHHVQAVHHGTSTLPPKSIEEFTSVGGVLGGREAMALKSHEGMPQNYNREMQGEHLEGDRHMHHTSENLTHGQGIGAHDSHSRVGNPVTGTHAGDHTHSHSNTGAAAAAVTGSGHHGSSTHDNRTHRSAQSGLESHGHTTGSGTDSYDHQAKKPSLADKLNPFKDSDHDGKKGFMD